MDLIYFAFVLMLLGGSSYAEETLEGIKVCTSSEEDMETCRDFSNGTNFITCTQLQSKDKDRYECMDSLSRGETELTFITGNEIITARRSNLSIIASSKKTINTLLIVNPIRVPTFDLDNKIGCFPYALDAGVLGLGRLLNEKSKGSQVDDIKCQYDVQINNTIGAACMPGIKDDYVKRSQYLTETDKDRMCQNCLAPVDGPTQNNCNANRAENYFAGTEGALRCLSDPKTPGDFAVVPIDDDIRLPDGAVVMCRNGTTTHTIQVDDDCLLSKVPAKLLVSTGNLSKNKVTKSREVLGRWEGGREYHGVLPDGSISFEPTEEESKILIDYENVDTCPIKRIKQLVNVSASIRYIPPNNKSFDWQKLADWLYILAGISLAGVLFYAFYMVKPTRNKGNPAID